MSYYYNGEFEVDEERLFRRTEFSHGAYRMDCLLNRDYEESRAFHVNIHLKFSGQVVGYLEGHLLPTRPDPSFYSVAEPIDGLLWEAVKSFCDARGVANRIDHPKLTSSPSKTDGGFFHISKLEVKTEHRGKDLGLYLIHYALVFLKDDWSLAVISPGIINSPKWHASSGPLESEGPMYMGGRLPSETLEDAKKRERRHEKAVQEAVVKISQHYARMGFLQASKNKYGVWFLTIDLYFRSTPEESIRQWIPKSQSDQIEVFQPTEWNELTGIDLELKTYLCGPTIDESRDLSGLKDLIRRGASLEASNAMVHAAFHNSVILFRTLIELGGDVNCTNERGGTPLHAAAVLRSTKIIEFLVEAGANRNVVDEADLTPMDWLQGVIRNEQDECFFVNLSPREDHVMKTYECLKLLMPQDKRNDLVDGWMSPRMKLVLECTTERCLEDIHLGFWELRYFPPTHKNVNVSALKVFVMAVWKHVGSILNSRCTPTVQRIKDKFDEEEYRMPSVSVAWSQGMKIEYVLDELLDKSECMVKEHSIEFMGDYEDEMETLPTNPLDGNFDLARVMCINRGGGTLQNRGPYRHHSLQMDGGDY